jgi:cell division septation protein DedD
MSFASELRELETRIASGGLSGAALQTACEKLALLFQFSGNIEGAAVAWTRAAEISGNAGDLLRAAQCFAALGEWDKAQEALRRLFVSRGDRAVQLRARYLDAQVNAFRSGGAGYSMLASFLNDPDYAESKALTYYLLWKFSGSESYKDALIREFAASPEARIASGEVEPPASALWLLFPAALQAPAQTTATAQTAAPTAAQTAAAAPAAAAQTTASAPLYLQTGLYSRRENAQAQAERLLSRGFSAALVEKTVNGNRCWSVTVPSGPDYNERILQLKDAGFESFPVFR